MSRVFYLYSFLVIVTVCFFSTSTPVLARDFLATSTDFDGDGVSDLLSYEPSGNIFTIRASKTKKFLQRQVGVAGAIAVPGDYDGDGRAELATYNRLTGEWVMLYLTGGQSSVTFGGAGYLPVPGRYSGNDCTDMAVYKRKTGRWRIRNCANGQIREESFGAGGVPVPGDYDCDRRTDVAVYDRFSGKWRVRLSSTNQDKKFSFGKVGDIPVPADYNGDGCTEAAVYRYSNGTFYVGKPRYYSGNVPRLMSKQWGALGDRPAVYALDKDYRADFSVYRAFDNYFYSSTSKGVYVPVRFGDKVIQTTGDTIDEDDSIFDQFSTVEEMIIAAIASEFCERQSGELRANFISRCQNLVWSTLNGSEDGFDDDDDDSSEYYDTISRQLVVDVLYKMYPVDSIGTSAEWSSTAPQISQNRIPTPVNLIHSVYQNVPGDFDRDGRTNVALVSSQDDSLRWTIIHDPVARTTFNFGVTDSDIVTGDYDGDGKAESIFVRDSIAHSGQLEWVTRDAYGIQSSSIWGKVGDRPVPGDFDCDGVYDQVVARKRGSDLYWHFRFSGGGSLTGKKFGKAAGTPFAADMNGDGCDEMVVAQKSGNEIAWYVKKPNSSGSVKPAKWGLSSDMPFKPHDFNGDGRADYAVVRTVGNARQFFIRFGYKSSSSAKGFNFGSIADLPTVGYFTSNSAADIGIYRYKEGVLYSLSMNGAANAVVGPKGAGLPLASDGTRIVNSTIGDGFDQFGCSVSYDFYDGASRGALWKPVSESNGNVVILLPSTYSSVRSVDLLGANAEYITSGRFRELYAGRVVFATSVRASSLASHNPITVRFKYNGLNVCYVVEDARVRAD